MRDSFINRILTGEILLYSDFYSSIQSIPKNILSSDEKIILYQFVLLSNLDVFEKGDAIELNQQDISKLTGISLIKIKRTIPKLCDTKKSVSQRMQKVNEYLTRMGRNESIILRSENYKGNNHRYVFEYTEPLRKKKLIFTPGDAAAAKNPDGKLQLLKLTGFQDEVLKQYLNNDIEKIDRNVKYFLEYQKLKSDKLGIAFLTSALKNDWGLMRSISTDEIRSMFFDALKAVKIIYQKNNFGITPAPSKNKIDSTEYNNIYQIINDLSVFGNKTKSPDKLKLFVDYCKQNLKFRFYSSGYLEYPFYIAVCTQVITELIIF